MKHQIFVPTFCLFLLLSLFSYGAETAKTQHQTNDGIAQSSILPSVNNFVSITAMALPIKVSPKAIPKIRSKASEISQKSEKTSNQDLFITGTFYGAVSIILLLNGICFFLFEEKIFGYFALAVTGTMILFFGEDSLSSMLFQDTILLSTDFTTTILCATAWKPLKKA